MSFGRSVRQQPLVKIAVIAEAAANDTKMTPPQPPAVRKAIAEVTDVVVDQVEQTGVPVGDKEKDA